MPEIHDDDASLNPSTQPHFTQVLRARVSRRTVMAGGLASAAAFFAAGCSTDSAAAPVAPSPTPSPTPIPRQDIVRATTSTLLGFAAIAGSTEDTIRVPEGYTATPFIPWGTALLDPYPEFKPGLNTAAEQEKQGGMHHDGMHFFPMTNAPGSRNRHGLLVLNHEYADEIHLATGAALGPLPALEAWTPEHVARSQAAHGVSVVEIRRDGKDEEWEVVRGRYNRRITANTPMAFSGPASGHRLLRTAADPPAPCTSRDSTTTAPGPGCRWCTARVR